MGVVFGSGGVESSEGDREDGEGGGGEEEEEKEVMIIN